MKIIKCILLIMMLVNYYGYLENTQMNNQQKEQVSSTEHTHENNFQFYQEYSNIFEGAIVKCGNSDTYYLKNVEVIDIDREQNKLLVTLRNPHKKRYSAFIRFEKLPTLINKHIDVVVGDFVKESFPPILDGKEIHQ